jgi:hypothetical protein
MVNKLGKNSSFRLAADMLPRTIKPPRMRPNLGGYRLVFIGLLFVIRISSLPGLRKNCMYVLRDTGRK